MCVVVPSHANGKCALLHKHMYAGLLPQAVNSYLVHGLITVYTANPHWHLEQSFVSALLLHLLALHP